MNAGYAGNTAWTHLISAAVSEIPETIHTPATEHK